MRLTLFAASVALASSSLAWAETPAATESVSEAVMQDRFDVVQRHVDAYRSGDLDQFLATFSHDAIVRADGFVAIGHEQIRALYELNFEPGAPQIKVHESYAHDGKVVLKIGYIMSDGQEWCCSISEYEIANGKVSFLRTGER